MSFFKIKPCLTLLLGLTLLAGCQTTPTNEKNSGTEQQKNKLSTKQQLAAQAALDVVVPASDELVSEGQKMHTSINHFLAATTIIAPTASASFKLAKQHIKNKEYAQAQQLLHALTTSHVTLSGPWLKLGDVATLQQKDSEAQIFYKKTIVVNANNYFARKRLAALYSKQGDFSAAKKQYQAAIVNWPGFILAHQNLGILLDLYIGDKEAALNQYQIAQELYQLRDKAINKQLKGWIADLTRQVARLKRQQETSNG